MALAVAAAVPLQAQSTGSVAGVVTDAAGGAPVAEASVFVEGTGRSALTDARGRFLLAGLPSGERTLVVERLGYATLRERLDVPGGGTAHLTLVLDGQALSVPAMVVTATREARRLDEVAAAVGVLDRGDLDDAHATHPSELLGRIPGVLVNVTGGEGHMTAIRQPLTTDPVYLYLEDGVPTRSTGFFNHNALYEINLPQAERVEVMKGPANALYGSDAIGGVVNVQTRAPSERAGIEASLEAGAYGYLRALGSASGRLGRDGVRLDANHTRTDGWRDGTEYQRWSATLRWDRTLGDGLSLKTVATWSSIDQGTAGSSALSRSDFESDPTRNYAPISWREVRALRISTEVEKRTARAAFTLTPYVRANAMDLLPNWSLSYDPAVWETGNRSFGVLARVRRDLPGLDGQVIVGADVDVSPGSHRERAITPVREGAVFVDYTQGAALYDYDVTFRQLSPYLQADAEIVPGLRATAGLRLDLMRYDYDNRLEPLRTGRHRRPADAAPGYAALSPKLGITYSASEALAVFGSYRRGFRAPAEGQLFRQGSAANTLGLEPVKADAFEVGGRGSAGSRLHWDLSLYHMTKKDDILGYQLADGSQETMNAGETSHRGVELGVGALLAAGLRLDAALSWAAHEYRAWSPRPGVDYAGRAMEAAPARMGNVGVSWSPPALAGLRLDAEWTHLGPYWMDADHSAEYEGHDLVGLGAAYDHGGGVSAFVRLHNATDRRYAERATFTAHRGEELAPGLPRTLYVGVEVR